MRKQRVETYLLPENVEKIEETELDKSEFIRQAVRRELQNYRKEEYEQ